MASVVGMGKKLSHVVASRFRTDLAQVNGHMSTNISGASYGWNNKGGLLWRVCLVLASGAAYVHTERRKRDIIKQQWKDLEDHGYYNEPTKVMHTRVWKLAEKFEEMAEDAKRVIDGLHRLEVSVEEIEAIKPFEIATSTQQ